MRTRYREANLFRVLGKLGSRLASHRFDETNRLREFFLPSTSLRSDILNMSEAHQTIAET